MDDSHFDYKQRIPEKNTQVLTMCQPRLDGAHHPLDVNSDSIVDDPQLS
jgi:hypothetical protein